MPVQDSAPATLRDYFAQKVYFGYDRPSNYFERDGRRGKAHPDRYRHLEYQTELFGDINIDYALKTKNLSPDRIFNENVPPAPWEILALDEIVRGSLEHCNVLCDSVPTDRWEQRYSYSGSYYEAPPTEIRGRLDRSFIEAKIQELHAVIRRRYQNTVSQPQREQAEKYGYPLPPKERLGNFEAQFAVSSVLPRNGRLHPILDACNPSEIANIAFAFVEAARKLSGQLPLRKRIIEAPDNTLGKDYSFMSEVLVVDRINDFHQGERARLIDNDFLQAFYARFYHRPMIHLWNANTELARTEEGRLLRDQLLEVVDQKPDRVDSLNRGLSEIAHHGLY